MATYSGAKTKDVTTAGAAMHSFAPWTGLTSDSRKVRPGYLFAALQGASEDGSRFIAEAVGRGAAAILGPAPLAPAAAALGVAFIADDNPRRRLALIAAEFYGAQPRTIAAITGTNGKTSVSVFLRQIWQNLGRSAASLGTIGLVCADLERALAHTTPDPVELHALLAELAGRNIQHVALEASSHGLDQFRLDGVRIAASAFTNLSRDHLDYHRDFEHYLRTKARLFGELTPAGAPAVLHSDARHAEAFEAVARARGLRVITVGTGAEASIRLAERQIDASGQRLLVYMGGREFAVPLPLIGAFQAANALVAAGLATALGEDAEAVFAALAGLKGADGRLERVATAKSGAAIYVDYAHTPDALETVLVAMRPHVKGRLSVVFGCGGDRDAGKRVLMGRAAAQFADVLIVTDDNPRSEDPARIRRQVLEGCPQAREIADRAEAIAQAIAQLQPHDALIIAGKGHERGQIVGAQTRAFSDRQEARKAARSLGGVALGEGAS